METQRIHNSNADTPPRAGASNDAPQSPHGTGAPTLSPPPPPPRAAATKNPNAVAAKAAAAGAAEPLGRQRRRFGCRVTSRGRTVGSHGQGRREWPERAGLGSTGGIRWRHKLPRHQHKVVVIVSHSEPHAAAVTPPLHPVGSANQRSPLSSRDLC